ANGTVYVGSDDHNLYAFDAAGRTGCSGTPKTCAPLWTAATGGAVNSSPAVANGVVYVGSDDDKLYAFGESWSAFRFAADHAGLNVNEHKINGENVSSLTQRYTATTGAAVGSSPAVANGTVYVGSEDGNLYAFDAAGTTNCSGTPKACSPLLTATTGGVVYSSPAVANGTVYVGSQDG